MKIEEFYTAQAALYKRLKEKAAAYLERNELYHLQYLLVIPTGLCKRDPKNWPGKEHWISEDDKLYEVSFSDGFMSGITFLVDDTDGEVISYR